MAATVAVPASEKLGLDLDNGLEQRVNQKVEMNSTADGNGLTDNEFEAEGAEPEANGHLAGDEAEEPEADNGSKLYFVRIPRPPMDDGLLKRLNDEFQAHVTKIKAINTKLAAKRDEVRELRREMGQARSLKDTSQPEYEEKLNRLKQLKDLRSSHQEKLKEVRSAVKGLECRTEEELDAKIYELEQRIQYGGLPIREEKMVVQQISKLNSQRAQVRDYQSQRSSTADIESELDKVKAVIKELEDEFSILKGERGSAQSIISDVYKRLDTAEKQLKELEEEQAEAVRLKDEARDALHKAREDVDDSMKDYRVNRNFSLKIRDLVAANQVEEARALVEAQVEEWVSKLNSDQGYRKEYVSLWASQRKYMVSELLPESSTAAAQLAQAAAAAKDTGKGKQGGAKAAAGPLPVPNGAEKARAIIAAAMQAATKEYQQKAAQRPGTPDSDGEHDANAEVRREPAAAAPKKAAEPYKPPAAAAAAAAAPAAAPTAAPKSSSTVFNYKVELPKIEDVEFVPPVIAKPAAPVDKDTIREEQRLKAQEAEERKRRRQEQADKKRLWALEQKKKEAEQFKTGKGAAPAAAGGAAAPQPAPSEPFEAAEAAAAPGAESTPAEAAAGDSKEAAPAQSSSKPAAAKAPLYVAKSLSTAAAKRPKDKGLSMKKVKKIAQENTVNIALGVVCLIIIILSILYART